MMTKPNRFVFERDFRDPQGRTERAKAVEVEAAEARAFERGLAEGRRQAAADAQFRLAEAAERLAGASAALLAREDERAAALEQDAIALGLALGRKLAGEALRADPMAAIAEAARSAFQHLRGVPHLAVRVHASLVEQAEALVRRLAGERAFEGRLVVLGELDIPPGDVRLEWADGGVAREGARIEAALLDALARAGLDPWPAPDSPMQTPSIRGR